MKNIREKQAAVSVRSRGASKRARRREGEGREPVGGEGREPVEGAGEGGAR